MPESLPDFVIIGASRSAATWLLQNLQAHPRIFMPDPELHYFSREFARGEAWYRAHFAAAGGRVTGERSASYLPHPDAPARLRALLPAARLVAQLRNPIARAYADYCLHFRRGQGGREQARHLHPKGTSVPRLLEDGLYFRHLSAFLERFPADQLQVILDDDIRTDPAPVYRAVCAHIGVEPEADAALLSPRIQEAEALVVPPLARRVLAPFESAVEPLRAHAAFRFARSLIARPPDEPELTPWLWEQLCDCYRADVEALEDLLDRNLGHWLLPPRRQARIG